MGRGFTPPLAESMAESGLKEVETYVTRRYNMVVEYILQPGPLRTCVWQRSDAWGQGC